MIKDRVHKILTKLNENIYEREDAVNFSFLSSIAGESIFLLGPPGVAKSLVARRLKFAFKEGKAFEYLMSRFSTPDEIFGPVSIKQLKDEDRYTRLVDNYLPGANIVFLDEIWKAGPAIQNSLLTVINEKIFRNGEEELKVDMKALISASNELPAKGEGLEALWDRFILRLYVSGIKERKFFDRMIVNTKNQYKDDIPKELKIGNDEYEKWSERIERVNVGPNIFDLVDAIRKKLIERNEALAHDEQIIVSDRRWKKVVRILRTSAFLNGRDEVDLIDCFIIPYCIWNNNDQIEEMKDLVKNLIRDRGYSPEIDPSQIRYEIDGLKKEIEKETATVKEITEKIPTDFQDSTTKKQYYKLLNYPKELFRKGNTGWGSRDNDYYLSKGDFKLLTNDSLREIPVYTCSSSTSNYRFSEMSRFKFRLVADYDLMVLNNNTENRLTVGHREEKKIVAATKPAHPALKREWDRSVRKLIKECETIIREINQFKENKRDDLFSHLFFGDRHGSIVLDNLENTTKSINKLKFEIEQTKYYYDNIPSGPDNMREEGDGSEKVGRIRQGKVM